MFSCGQRPGGLAQLTESAVPLADCPPRHVTMSEGLAQVLSCVHKLLVDPNTIRMMTISVEHCFIANLSENQVEFHLELN